MDPNVCRLIAECDSAGGVRSDQKARDCVSSYRISADERDLSPIVSGNIRLIVSVASAYSASAEDMSDLVQEGVIGFLNGLRKFDLDRHPVKPVCNYAILFARKAILEYLEVNGRTMRIGRLAQQAYNEALRRLEKSLQKFETLVPIDVLLRDKSPLYRLGALDMHNGMRSLDAEDGQDIDVPDLAAHAPDPSQQLASACASLSPIARDMLFAERKISSESLIDCSARYQVAPAEGRQIAARAFRDVKLRTETAPGEAAADTQYAVQLSLF